MTIGHITVKVCSYEGCRLDNMEINTGVMAYRLKSENVGLVEGGAGVSVLPWGRVPG